MSVDVPRSGMSRKEIERILSEMTSAEKHALDDLLNTGKLWEPLPGAQTMAYESAADITGYGGAAGGGKTSLGVGLALTAHQRSIIFRQTGTELTGVVNEIARVTGEMPSFDRYGVHRRPDGRELELGSFPNIGDELKYQGRDHDLIVFDETPNMREQAVRFLMGWLRSIISGQRCRVIMPFNPPTTVEGRWVIEFFGPWLDQTHKNPAKPGELRWYVTGPDGKDIEVDSDSVITVDGVEVKPMSRTFIPARVVDNPYLADTGYMATLMSMPEPLRSQMLYGDFSAGTDNDPWQVIPTKWVDIAQARWKKPDKLPPMDSMGVDVARGGTDKSIIARRHGWWFDEPLTFEKLDGSQLAGQCVASVRDRAPIHIDVIGVGASPFDFLNSMDIHVVGINVAESAPGFDKSGKLKFKNLRSYLWWKYRELLDPENNNGVALPPSKELKADLCAPTWKMVGTEIYVLSREEIIKKIGRSPDYGSAYIMSAIETQKTISYNYDDDRSSYQPEWTK